MEAIKLVIGHRSIPLTIQETRWKPSNWSLDDILWLNIGDSGASARYLRKSKSFLDFVDRVLTFDTVQSIHRFSTGYSLAYCTDSSRLNKWICNALMRNLVEIHVSLRRGCLPQIFLVSDKLMVLKLEYLTALSVPDHVSFSILKVLHLKHLSCLDDASARKLLSASPCLEELLVVSFNMALSLMFNDASIRKLLSASRALEELVICRRYDHCLLTVHVHSCTLKRFTINGGFELVVDAPNLEFHELKDCIPKDLNSMGLTALAKAVVGANVKNATTTFDDYIHREESTIIVTQTRYLLSLLQKFGLDGAKPVNTPLASGASMSATDGVPLNDPSHYRCLVGSLQYLTLTRPDISFAVHQVCRFMQTPHDTRPSTVP
ncbi:hypothetical protein DKX38_027567 [Salix brachista]|uniref:Reverse transcriptase Ty1/copia-type domain-containing protein n=1 Tax=Salix brachista TaxID=2182728 RepID=A0A5N5J3I8_9ROSI|nr:hypothetical protein DKX38_027567 [Salix brachista]